MAIDRTSYVSAIVVAVLAAAFSIGALGADLKILSTVGVKTVVEELAPRFERETGHRLSIAYGVSNIMKKQIAEGESFDVAIMTSPVTDELIAQGHLVAATRTDIAHGGIGIAVRTGAGRPDISSVEALKRTLLEAKSIAYSKVGASGIYFAALLERLGIAEAMRAKTKYGTSNVGEMVANGDAQLGVQLINELMPIAGLEIVGPLPPEVQSYVTLSAGVGARSEQPGVARDFIRYLTAPAALPVIRAKGLEPGGA